MKALFLTKYSQRGASSRYRALQYFPCLRSQGWDIAWQPFLTDSYLAGLYSHGLRPKPDGLKALARRVRFLRTYNLDEVDVIYVQDEVLFRVPSWVERWMFGHYNKVVLDYDDAVFLPYKNNIFLRNKIEALAGQVAHVIVGNNFLHSYMSQFTSRLTVIPTVIDLDKYVPRETYNLCEGQVIIGWIGTPSTAHHLKSIAPVLARLSQRFRVLLRCVGVPSDFSLPGVEAEILPWSEDTEGGIVRTFDIGIMPLRDEAFAKGKCGLKLIQYMGCGVPAIGQSVGANTDIIHDGVNGFLASSNEEYIEKMEALITGRSLREKLGRAGRQTVEQRYALRDAALRLSGVLAAAAKRLPNPERMDAPWRGSEGSASRQGNMTAYDDQLV